ncbi:MAG TPA: CD225/dispanin family protein [Candidatus Coprenecus stercoravium]|uniref:CD225/dispanin family protein n=1 Tax=Candidatus Coprenecus stercoravium TaxID=2840735 RepID=A0A9D2K9L9_9BACT|nr:CD225/dispanin family protein [Candidatus Coprenecus stercoravium]
MYCKNCGTQLPDGTKFCTNCGQSLSEDRPGMSYPRAEMPPTYLVLSILVTILCCLPFGIIGIVYASKVDSYWSAGRVDEAYAYSRKARKWSLAGILLSVVLLIVYLILILIGVSWATWWDDSIYYTTACLF